MGFFKDLKKANADYKQAVSLATENVYKNATGLRNCDSANFMVVRIDDAIQVLNITYTFLPQGSTDVNMVEQGELNIPFSDLCSVKAYTEQEIIEKQRSVLKRAVVGGVLLGSVGAVVLGMSGVNGKQKLKDTYYIGIEYVENGEEKLISGEYNISTDQITPGLLKNIHERMSENPTGSTKDLETVKNEPENIVSQLEKLVSLKNQGILDENEFKAAKERILSK